MLPGRRTALMVCQAMIIAMTVVLPAPVASFSARRISSGLASSLALARCSRNRLPALPSFGATSVSQIAVSTASTWQKNGRTLLNLWCRQCWRSRAVSGVTSQSFGFGQVAPLVHVIAEFVDEWRRVVLLLFGRESLAFVEDRVVPVSPCCLLRASGSA